MATANLTAHHEQLTLAWMQFHERPAPPEEPQPEATATRVLAELEAEAKERMSAGGKGTEIIPDLGEARDKAAKLTGTNRPEPAICLTATDAPPAEREVTTDEPEAEPEEAPAPTENTCTLQALGVEAPKAPPTGVRLAREVLEMLPPLPARAHLADIAEDLGVTVRAVRLAVEFLQDRHVIELGEGKAALWPDSYRGIAAVARMGGAA